MIGGWSRTRAGLCKCWGVTIGDPDCHDYVLIRLFFSALLHSRYLHKKDETMVSEAHCKSYPCTELIIQLCQAKDSFSVYGTFKL